MRNARQSFGTTVTGRIVAVHIAENKYRVEWRMNDDGVWTATAVTYNGVSLEAAVQNLVNRVKWDGNKEVQWRIVEVP